MVARTIVTSFVALVTFLIDPCGSENYFEVLNQPQRSPVLRDQMLNSRLNLYGNPASSFPGGSDEAPDYRRRRKRPGNRRKQGQPIELNAEEFPPAPPSKSLQSADFHFPVVLNDRPAAINEAALNTAINVDETAPARGPEEYQQPSTTTTSTTTSTTTAKPTPKITARHLLMDSLISQVEDEEPNDLVLNSLPEKRSYRGGSSRKNTARSGSRSKSAAQKRRRPSVGRSIGAAMQDEEAAEDTDNEESTIATVHADAGGSASDTAGSMATGSHSDAPGSMPAESSPDTGASMSAGPPTDYQTDISGPMLDFVENGTAGMNGTTNSSAQTGAESAGGGLSDNWTLEEYEEYCNVEDNDRRKRICAWNVGFSNATLDDDENYDPPLDLNNLFETGERTNPDKKVAEEVHQIAKINRKLMIDTIKGAIWPYTLVDTEPLNGFRLLNTTRAVFAQICPPHVVPAKILNSVILAFKRMYDLTSPGRSPFLSDFETDLIEGILQQCQANTHPPNYIQNECKEDVVAVNSTKNVLCVGFMLTEGVNRSTACYQTNVRVYDPVLDIAWLMFEAVKANCFNYFQGNIRLLHRYSVAIKDMFTKPLKSRWPLQREPKEYWERLLGPGLDLALSNIDKCVHHAVLTSEFDFRTPRFLSINSVRLSHTIIEFLQRRRRRR